MLLRIDAAVDPAASRGAAIAFHLFEAVEEFTGGEVAAVDLLQHVADVGFLVAAGASIGPWGGVQRGVLGAGVSGGPGFQARRQMMNEPTLATRISGRIDGLDAELHE